ncbi:sensor histidine kinase [Streptomyces sp. NPDC007172]|uniref:sensor histidine kinase n=1 Tax=Streptomyces sp. NPDC007172 TaxID=3364776 RepID=UPI0036922B9D
MSDGPWHCRHPLAVDTAIAVCFTVTDLAITLVGATWWPERPGPLAWALLGAQALACLSLVARRRAPLTVVAVLGAFTLAVTLLISPVHALTPADPGNVWAPFSTALAAYGPVFYGRTARNRRTVFLVLGLFTLVVARAWEPSVTVLTIGLLRTAVGPLLALYFDARRRIVCDLTERAERERHLLAERARAEERGRLAGEMHDVVTHRVSLMVLQAGALRVTASDEATRRAAEELRAAGCQALEELRDLVGILRTAPEEDRTPSPDGLAALVAESTAAGVPTELIEVGDRSLASPVVGRTTYRVVREALTNVHQHACGARVTVTVAYDGGGVRVTVRNTRPSGSPDSALVRTGSGLGIAGLRRRIELVHGCLRAGPEPGGGFCVAAELPAYVPTAQSVG